MLTKKWLSIERCLCRSVGRGKEKGQDEVCVLRHDFWFLIPTDSAIFRSATSLHTLYDNFE